MSCPKTRVSPPNFKPQPSAIAGIRRDLKAAKEGGGAYDPNAVGTAWSHNFLNQVRQGGPARFTAWPLLAHRLGSWHTAIHPSQLTAYTLKLQS
jgi:hypothetical protein